MKSAAMYCFLLRSSIWVGFYEKSWRQYPTRHQLYGHLPPITKTIQVRRTRHAGHCWRSQDELISDVLRWTLTYGQAKAGRPARTYIQQLCEDTGCNPEDLPKAMNDREKWRERVRDIRAGGTTRWWWWLWGGVISPMPSGFWMFSFIFFFYIGSVAYTDDLAFQANTSAGSVGWGCRIHRLHLCRGVRLLR